MAQNKTKTTNKTLLSSYVIVIWQCHFQIWQLWIWTHASCASGTWGHPLRPFGQTVSGTKWRSNCDVPIPYENWFGTTCRETKKWKTQYEHKHKHIYKHKQNTNWVMGNRKNVAQWKLEAINKINPATRNRNRDHLISASLTVRAIAGSQIGSHILLGTLAGARVSCSPMRWGIHSMWSMGRYRTVETTCVQLQLLPSSVG